jgi:rhodanese-related sulfurtransferase
MPQHLNVGVAPTHEDQVMAFGKAQWVVTHRQACGEVGDAMTRLWNSTAKILSVVGALALINCHSEATTQMSNQDRLARIEEMVAGFKPKFRDVPVVQAAALKAELASGGTVLVDVRSDEERAISMIAGAISSAEFERQAAELEGSPVVTYCTIGYRSSAYAEKLLRDGWNVRNLEGSILAWTHAGGELVDPAGNPTRRVNVYAERWNLVADGYEPVY